MFLHHFRTLHIKITLTIKIIEHRWGKPGAPVLDNGHCHPPRLLRYSGHPVLKHARAGSAATRTQYSRFPLGHTVRFANNNNIHLYIYIQIYMHVYECRNTDQRLRMLLWLDGHLRKKITPFARHKETDAAEILLLLLLLCYTYLCGIVLLLCIIVVIYYAPCTRAPGASQNGQFTPPAKPAGLYIINNNMPNAYIHTLHRHGRVYVRPTADTSWRLRLETTAPTTRCTPAHIVPVQPAPVTHLKLNRGGTIGAVVRGTVGSSTLTRENFSNN